MNNPPYITNIFERLELRHIREFLLHGVQDVPQGDESYHERLEKAYAPVQAVLEKAFPDSAQRGEAESEIHRCLGTMRDVYMEIGLHCGAELLSQLTLP